MSSAQPRADERAALHAICAVVDVDDFEWVPETHKRRTPDLRLKLADGRIVFVEVTLSADQVTKGLTGASGSKKPFRFDELSWDWVVWVTDGHPQERSDLGRRLKAFVAAMVPVLTRAESENSAPEEMQSSTTEMFDVKPFHPQRMFLGGPRYRWLHESTPDTEFEDWALHSWLPGCEYWFVTDLEDCVLHKLEPRGVRVADLPTPAADGQGCIEVHVSPTEQAFAFAAADYLIAAIRRAVVNKQKKDQMAGYVGEHWLAVAVDGNAAAQLEEACAPGEPSTPADLSGVVYDGYNELWVIGCTFHDRQLAVARFSKPGQQPALFRIPRPPMTS